MYYAQYQNSQTLPSQGICPFRDLILDCLTAVLSYMCIVNDHGESELLKTGAFMAGRSSSARSLAHSALLASLARSAAFFRSLTRLSSGLLLSGFRGV